MPLTVQRTVLRMDELEIWSLLEKVARTRFERAKQEQVDRLVFEAVREIEKELK